jgi:hypothetical protein
MLIGHALPVAAQAFIFIAVVSVETTALLTLIPHASLAVGSAQGWFGSVRGRERISSERLQHNLVR